MNCASFTSRTAHKRNRLRSAFVLFVLRMRWYSNAISLAPFEHYLIGFQRHVNRNVTIGLLAEKISDADHQPSIKLSAMSRWSIHRLGVQCHVLVNSERETGLALTHQIGYIPLILQAFSLYSWKHGQWKWGVGLQCFLWTFYRGLILFRRSILAGFSFCDENSSEGEKNVILRPSTFATYAI